MSDSGEKAMCSCCGQQRSSGTMATLERHKDISICRECISGLARRSGMLDSTPTLPVRAMTEAVRFFEAAGFDVESYDGGFAFVRHAGSSVFDLALEHGLDPGQNRAGCFITTDDADEWHARLSTVGFPVTAIADMPWGMHEFTLTDPSGNRLRIGRST